MISVIVADNWESVGVYESYYLCIIILKKEKNEKTAWMVILLTFYRNLRL